MTLLVPGQKFVRVTASALSILPRLSLAFQPPTGAGIITQRSRSVIIPAPVGGWNARDSLGNMDKADAVTLTNFWPGTNSVILRKGYTQHATGLNAQVETL